METQLMVEKEMNYIDYAKECVSEFFNKHGVLPKKTQINEVLSTNMLISKFGSWKNALVGLGFEEQLETKKEKQSALKEESSRIQEERIAALKEEVRNISINYIKDCNELPNYKILKESGVKLSQFKKCFESINAMVEEFALNDILKESVSVKIMEFQSDKFERIDCKDLEAINIKPKHIRKIFGSWKSACEQMNLDGLREDLVKEEIVALTDEVKKVPTLNEISERNIPMEFIKKRQGKGWNELKKDWKLYDIEDKHIENEIIRLSNNLDNTPRVKDLKEYGIKYRGFLKRNEGFENALKKIGLPKYSKYSYTDFKNLEAEVYEIAESLGEVPTFKYLSEQGIKTNILSKRYGSWSDFLITIGLTPKQYRTDSAIKYLETEIIKLSDKLGRTPNIKDFKENKLPITPITRKYGSLENFYIENGIAPNRMSRKNYDKVTVINRLLNLVKSNEGKMFKKGEAKKHGINVKCLCEDLGSWKKVTQIIKDNLLSDELIVC